MSNNYIRFDWAIKRLLRNKADFTVLEGFLTELLKESIKIENILESEGNQTLETDKYNRVDILVKNAKGEFVIIEIQNQKEYDYFQRMLYGTSKVITEYLHLGERYKEVKKVYSINIVYFDLGQGEDYVYLGKTDFKGLHQKDILSLSPKQQELLKGIKEPADIFPEYYVIKVNQFDNVAKDTLDQWIYYLKNDEIREEFTAKGMKEARELWRVDRLSSADRKSYMKHMEYLSDQASLEWTMKVDAEDKVRKGEKYQIAKSLKSNGVDVGVIMKSTGLSREEIEQL
ncbi:Rpn family recombination-promoting nuclease/putative transposase [Flammeovirga sp. EKP202]|uniref:Rpn family recombination-promoting nuclease/putative transposase n=1 Tax=Flammeovirga sp. EKP202 TaxID=2770592 RepID=UPI00165F19FD|nr:Rpn family recombination-promoting nuclease/putative transposase [Flammeovirga sp. EKP202]MBD0402644.1 Rpn family recombination-promoting nuclease/putative transposase [Flammeovirga sp. EKP202]